MFLETLIARGDASTSLKAFVLKAFMQAVVVLKFVSSDRYNFSLWNDPKLGFIMNYSSAP